MSTLKVDTIQDTNAVEMYLCKAWVNFDGITASIRDSGNVSSITDNGTGDYRITFTNAMPDTDYVVVTNGGSPNVTSGTATAGNSFQINASTGSPYFEAPSTTTCRIISVTAINNYTTGIDCGFCNVAVFR